MNTSFTDFTKSNVDIQAFVEGEASPFKNLDFSQVEVYEVVDYTFRTPLEKMDVFNKLLLLPYECKIWILPVTEKTTELLAEMKNDEEHEKVASLFSMLSKVRETIERDRTFLVAKCTECGELLNVMKEFGFTLFKQTEEELQSMNMH